MKRKRLLSFVLNGNTYYVEYAGPATPLPAELGDARDRRLFIEATQAEFDSAAESEIDPPTYRRRKRSDPRPLRASVNAGPGPQRWTLLLEPHPDRGYSPAVLSSLSEVAEKVAGRVLNVLEGSKMYPVERGGVMVVASGEGNPFVGIDHLVGISTFAEW